MKITARFSIVQRQNIVDNSHKCLWTDEGKLGLDYLTIQRGLSLSAIKAFNLGYMPLSVNHQLAGRVIFPIYDPSGNLVSVASRLVNDKKSSILPKHWHEAFQKTFYLYGMNVARNFIRQEAYVIVVEGQIDVCQMYNHDIKNVVGSMGTKFSSVHLSSVLRYCDEIIFMFDEDPNKSGQKGIEKIIEKYSSKNKVGVVSLPNNFDPDEYLLKIGSKSMRTILNLKKEELRSIYGNL